MLNFNNFTITELEELLKEKQHEAFQMTFNKDLIERLEEIEQIKEVISFKTKELTTQEE
jgi:hypothetical protein